MLCEFCIKFGFLLVYLRLCLLGGGDAPHLVEGVHVEGEVVEAAFVVGDGGVGVAVELYDGVDEVPHLFVGGMEDMCAILMDVDALDVLAIDVAAQVWAFVDDEARLALLAGEVGERGSEEPGAHDEIVVMIIVHKIQMFYRDEGNAF